MGSKGNSQPPGNRIEKWKPVSADFVSETVVPSGVGPTTFTTLKGEQSLYRFGRVNFGEQQCWFPQDVYLAAQAYARKHSGAGTSGEAMRRYFRQVLAVSLDWNDFSRLNVLHLPAGVQISAWESTIAPQPEVSKKEFERVGRSGSAASAPILTGGAPQYWLWPVPDWFETKPDFLKENI